MWVKSKIQVKDLRPYALEADTTPLNYPDSWCLLSLPRSVGGQEQSWIPLNSLLPTWRIHTDWSWKCLLTCGITLCFLDASEQQMAIITLLKSWHFN